MAPAANGVAKALVSTYFETPDRALRRAGLVVRVREEDGRFVQTVKSDAAATENPLARGEWEDAVADNRPDPDAPHSGRLLPREAVAELRPLFVTEVSRTAIDLEPSRGILIEAAIDRGNIRSGDGTRVDPVCEVEFELKEGEPAALYDLALRLLKTAPLRLEPRSKAERGYRLVEEDGAQPPSPYFAAPVDLDRRISVDDALQRIGRTCLAHFMRNEAAVLAAAPEGIHQMRVALRRLRAALLAFKGAIAPYERRRIAEDLAWLNEPLGAARNLDVFATQLLRPADADLDLHDLGLALEEARRRGLRAGARADHGAAIYRNPAAVDALVRDLRLARGPGKTGKIWQCRSASWRPRCWIAAAAKSAAAGRDFAGWRQESGINCVSRSRTCATRSSFSPASSTPPEVEQYVRRLKRLQDDLGYANDVRVAHDLVAHLCPPEDPHCAAADAARRLLEQHDRALARDEPELCDHLRRLNRADPFWRD